MSDTSSCPNDPRQVSDRQVDTLTGFLLRSELGTSQPSDEVWGRLQNRLVFGDTPPGQQPVVPPPLATRPLERSRALRVQYALLTTAPRLSSVGAALALFFMFVNSSLGLLNPGGLSGQPEQIIHPADPTAFVMQKLDARSPVDRPDEWYDQPITVTYAPQPAVEESPAVVMAAEDPSTLVPPQSISQNERGVWSAMPSARDYRYVGLWQR